MTTLSEQMVQIQQQHRHCTIADVFQTCKGQSDLPLAYFLAFVAPAQLCCKAAVAHVTVDWQQLVETSGSVQHHVFASCFAG